MDKEYYRSQPSSASSLSYWKSNCFVVPKNLKVIRDDLFRPIEYEGYSDELFFKLTHHLEEVFMPSLPDGFVLKKAEVSEIASHINSCYEHEGVTTEELQKYQERPVYDSDLWLTLFDTQSGTLVASGIAEYDKCIREGSFEWIQVSPHFRRRGLGEFIVLEFLKRLKGKADFVTVSGKVHSASNPERLYEKCGFTDKVIWHVLREYEYSH